ncbi:MAG TPA: D-glycero-beta-D-manno-heptose 1-phosphate adenylyltransferase [Candidatus Cloacimonadota bacterium]|nr:D-glycero-beta-D-manno-heptose 1-phosphate adenylyltransferase [Candidatus Cloacimonadota bacterium]
MNPKLKTRQEISSIVQEIKKQGKNIVFTNGCFDILHAGHIQYLQEAKKLGDVLIVGLNSDASVKRLKGDERPINNETDRAIVLSALTCVDYVVIFEQDTPLELINLILPHFLVKGGDWIPEDIVGSDIVIASGGIVKSLPYKEGYSTTRIIKKMRI